MQNQKQNNPAPGRYSFAWSKVIQKSKHVVSKSRRAAIMNIAIEDKRYIIAAKCERLKTVSKRGTSWDENIEYPFQLFEWNPMKATFFIQGRKRTPYSNLGGGKQIGWDDTQHLTSWSHNKLLTLYTPKAAAGLLWPVCCDCVLSLHAPMVTRRRTEKKQKHQCT